MPKRKRRYTRHPDPVPYRVLEPAQQVPGTSRRSLGSSGRITPKMLAYNTLRLAGVEAIAAARRAGYLQPYDAVERNAAHPGLIAYNEALLARHGLTRESVAEGIQAALVATRPVALVVPSDSVYHDGEKVLVQCADNVARVRAVELLADLLGMTPRARSKAELSPRHASQSGNGPSVRQGALESHAPVTLTGAALRKEFERRMATLSEDTNPAPGRVIVRDPVSNVVIEVSQQLRQSMQNAARYGCASITREVEEAGGFREWRKLQTERRLAARRRRKDPTP